MPTTSPRTAGLRFGVVDSRRGGAGKAIRFVAATEGRKADGIDLQMAGARLQRYQANPVVGYGHRYIGRENLPIGRSTACFVEGSRLVADIELDEGDEFAMEVDRKIRAGVLSAVSIGFDVIDIDRATGICSAWELTEISVVPVPMDPDAVALTGRSARAFLERPTTTAPGRLAPSVLLDALRAPAGGSSRSSSTEAKAATLRRQLEFVEFLAEVERRTPGTVRKILAPAGRDRIPDFQRHALAYSWFRGVR